MNNQQFLQQCRAIVGNNNVLTGETETEHYRTGFRSGQGDAIAVLFPETLKQQWQLLQACVESDKIIIMQAANTGLTEGSTPNGNDYDRDVVLINTRKLDKLILLGEGEQVVSFPGASLFTLEKMLAPLKRAPHSVIGSSCIGASIVGGVANNSGGALIKRGPAYTELSLFAQITEQGELQLVNHLGINLGDTPEEILDTLENETFSQADIINGEEKASASDYPQIIRDISAATPARYNADMSRLY